MIRPDTLRRTGRTPARLVRTALLAAIVTGGSAVSDDAAPNPARVLLDAWTEATYRTEAGAREQRLARIDAQARQAVANEPDNAELLAWAGIVAASHAGEKGGLGALSVARRAKAWLERAIALEPNVIEGGARTGLGVLYDRVPGWPLGFGDDDRAEALLAEAARLNPDNANAQFFHGEFLAGHGRPERAREAFERARAIPVRPDTLVADRGLQSRVLQALQRLDAP